MLDGLIGADVWVASSLGLAPPEPTEEFRVVAGIARAAGCRRDWDEMEVDGGGSGGGAGGGGAGGT
jgi:hypothetical protein